MSVLIAKQGGTLTHYCTHQASSCQRGLHGSIYQTQEKAVMEGCTFSIMARKKNKAPKQKHSPEYTLTDAFDKKGLKLLYYDIMRSRMALLQHDSDNAV